MGGTDPFAPKVVNASVGAMAALRLWRCPADLAPIPAAKSALHALVARDGVHPRALRIGAAPFVVVGNEAHGLPEHWIRAARHRVTLPMAEGVEASTPPWPEPWPVGPCRRWLDFLAITSRWGSPDAPGAVGGAALVPAPGSYQGWPESSARASIDQRYQFLVAELTLKSRHNRRVLASGFIAIAQHQQAVFIGCQNCAVDQRRSHARDTLAHRPVAGLTTDGGELLSATLG